MTSDELMGRYLQRLGVTSPPTPAWPEKYFGIAKEAVTC
jgi:hypothetical protein